MPQRGAGSHESLLTVCLKVAKQEAGGAAHLLGSFRPVTLGLCSNPCLCVSVIAFTGASGAQAAGGRERSRRLCPQIRVHGLSAGSTCHRARCPGHLCFLDGHQFSWGACQAISLAIYGDLFFLCHAGPDTDILSNPDLLGFQT